MDKISIFWFRRDLRLEDNAGLYYALKSKNKVLPLFIFDSDILNELPTPYDTRVEFIHDTLKALHEKLITHHSSLLIRHGKPLEVWEQLLKEFSIAEVFTNHDYEPYATKRDQNVEKLLREFSVPFHTYKDQVIFEKEEVLKDDGKPYTVYSPYSRKWKSLLNDFYLKSYPTNSYFKNFFNVQPLAFPSLNEIGFKQTGTVIFSINVEEGLIKNYENTRNYPEIEGTSKLGIHLRFGTISIRKLASQVKELSEIYLNELIWREFFMMILYHFPQAVHHSFKRNYDHIKWRNNEEEFKRWCNGETGYPIVDAGMRELEATGFMHNRVRMITASFLCKHLLIDWRWGESYFAQKLLDYDLASNNGNWQWAAGSGCDAAPYFRVFNPYLQTQKFDKDLKYVKKWVPEFQEFTYPKPIVDHEFARKRALETYKKGLGQKVGIL